jgi:competence protein ComEC
MIAPTRLLRFLLLLLLLLLPWVARGGQAVVLDATTGASPEGTLTIRFLDVGQGDGVLLQLPDGKTVLVDGGKPDGGTDHQLRALGVERIDLLIASHADYDHAGVHEVILADFDVVTYITNGRGHTSKSHQRITALASQQVAVGDLTLHRASDFKMGQDIGSGGVELRLMPPPVLAEAEQNTQSIGLVVVYGTFKALMTGDSEKKQTDVWLAQNRVRKLIAGVDVYKAIHHGARDGDVNNRAWLGRVSPDVVVITVGRNSYGHPTDDALAAYLEQDAQVLRTDQDGGVVVWVGPDGSYQVESGERLRPTPTLSPDELSRASVGSGGDHPQGAACPDDRPIKGNQGRRSWIYHSPGQEYYEATTPEACFTSAEEAEAAGYRASKK